MEMDDNQDHSTENIFTEEHYEFAEEIFFEKEELLNDSDDVSDKHFYFLISKGNCSNFHAMLSTLTTCLFAIPLDFIDSIAMHNWEKNRKMNQEAFNGKLSGAAFVGQFNNVQLFITKGTDISAKDKNGNTPLQ